MTRTFRGYINKKNNVLFINVVKEIIEETAQAFNKKFILSNEYVNDFLYQKHKGKRIEFTAVVENKKNLKNIRVIQDGGFEYNDIERRTSLKDLIGNGYHIFTGVFEKVKQDGHRLKYLLKDIKKNGTELISDHVFLEFLDNKVYMQPNKTYVFVAKAREYTKGYSKDSFYAFQKLSVNHFTKYDGEKDLSKCINFDFDTVESTSKIPVVYVSENLIKEEYLFQTSTKQYRFEKSLFKNFPFNTKEFLYTIEYKNSFRLNTNLQIVNYVSSIENIEVGFGKKVKKFSDTDNTLFMKKGAKVINLVNTEMSGRRTNKLMRDKKFFIGSVKDNELIIHKHLFFDEIKDN